MPNSNPDPGANGSTSSGGVGHAMEALSLRATTWAGSSWAFAIACFVIVAWAVTGPIFHYSDTWQLVINTGTTIVTFLMVFLIQRAQNKEAKAVQLKLNEIVAAVQGASNRLIDVENLSEEEIGKLQKHFSKISALAKSEGDLGASHTIEEAEDTLEVELQHRAEVQQRAKKRAIGK